MQVSFCGYVLCGGRQSKEKMEQELSRQQAPRDIEVVVPPGVCGGQSILVQAADDVTVTAVVPEGLQPGQRFTIPHPVQAVREQQPEPVDISRVEEIVRSGGAVSYAVAQAYCDAREFKRENYSGCYVVRMLSCCGGCPVACAYHCVPCDCCLCLAMCAVPFIPVPLCACSKDGNSFITTDHGKPTGAISLIDEENGTLGYYSFISLNKDTPDCLCVRSTSCCCCCC